VKADLIALIAALLAAPGGANSAALLDLRRLDQGRMNCTVALADPFDPGERQACEFKAIQSYARLPHKGRTKEFERLLYDLWEPLVFRAAGGDDALAMRVAVTVAEADFARARAGVLTGAYPVKEPNRQRRNPFDWVSNSNERKRLAQRWDLIRDHDCQAYKVRDCGRRLDAGLQWLMDQTAPNRS